MYYPSPRDAERVSGTSDHQEMPIFLKQQKLTRLLVPSSPNHRDRHDALHKYNLHKTHSTRILLNQISQKLYLPSFHAVIQDHHYHVVPLVFPTLQVPTAITLKQILMVAPFLLLSWPSMPHHQGDGLLRMHLVETLNNLLVAWAQLHPVP